MGAQKIVTNNQPSNKQAAGKEYDHKNAMEDFLKYEPMTV